MYSTLVSALVTSALLLGAAFGLLTLADLDVEASVGLEGDTDTAPGGPEGDGQRGERDACDTRGEAAAAPAGNSTTCS